MAALKILIGDAAGALDVTNTYFTKQYMTQVVANGEQASYSKPSLSFPFSSYLFSHLRLRALALITIMPTIWLQ